MQRARAEHAKIRSDLKLLNEKQNVLKIARDKYTAFLEAVLLLPLQAVLLLPLQAANQTHQTSVSVSSVSLVGAPFAFASSAFLFQSAALLAAAPAADALARPGRQSCREWRFFCCAFQQPLQQSVPWYLLRATLALSVQSRPVGKRSIAVRTREREGVKVNGWVCRQVGLPPVAVVTHKTGCGRHVFFLEQVDRLTDRGDPYAFPLRQLPPAVVGLPLCRWPYLKASEHLRIDPAHQVSVWRVRMAQRAHCLSCALLHM
jgi:hypothetical protein